MRSPLGISVPRRKFELCWTLAASATRSLFDLKKYFYQGRGTSHIKCSFDPKFGFYCNDVQHTSQKQSPTQTKQNHQFINTSSLCSNQIKSNQTKPPVSEDSHQLNSGDQTSHTTSETCESMHFLPVNLLALCFTASDSSALEIAQHLPLRFDHLRRIQSIKPVRTGRSPWVDCNNNRIHDRATTSACSSTPF